MTKPVLTYFDLSRSRGEECRLALFLAGVDFEDRRIPSKEWAAFKPKTPFGSMPVFEIAGRPPVSQSNAILGYIGRRYGLLPKDDWEAMRLESLLSACEDLRYAVNKTTGIRDPEEVKRKRAELVEGPVLTWGANMERQIVGPFAGGDTLTVADIKLYVIVNWFRSGVLDHVPTDVFAKFPKLEGVWNAVKGHPKVVEWYARPATAP
jgi:prostaglandin-H2 D-isomerase / glutathione transferase